MLAAIKMQKAPRPPLGRGGKICVRDSSVGALRRSG